MCSGSGSWAGQRRRLRRLWLSNPEALCFSIEDNLKPTVQWFRELGLTDAQIAKAVAGFPQLLGYSIEGNLKRKVSLLRQLFADDEIILRIARFPQLLGYSCERIEARLALFQSRDLLEAFPSALALTEEAFKTRFLWGLSDANAVLKRGDAPVPRLRECHFQS